MVFVEKYRDNLVTHAWVRPPEKKGFGIFQYFCDLSSLSVLLPCQISDSLRNFLVYVKYLIRNTKPSSDTLRH